MILSTVSRHEWGLFVLRIGLAAVFLWFGFSQLLDGLSWVYFVPQWAVDLLHIPPAMIVLGNGAFEVVAGALLAMGFFVRPIAILFALHLAVLSVDLGLSASGVRDIGLTAATVALALLRNSRKLKEVSRVAQQ